MRIKKKKINIGDLVEVDFDYHWQVREQRMCNSIYVVVDMDDTCYFVVGMGKPMRCVSKKKCRLHNGRG